MRQSILLNYLASQGTGKQERSNSTSLLHWCRPSSNLQLHAVRVGTAGKAHPPAQVPGEPHRRMDQPPLVTAGAARTEVSGERARWRPNARGEPGGCRMSYLPGDS